MKPELSRCVWHIPDANVKIAKACASILKKFRIANLQLHQSESKRKPPARRRS